jgi:hypothetical protein
LPLPLLTPPIIGGVLVVGVLVLGVGAMLSSQRGRDLPRKTFKSAVKVGIRQSAWVSDLVATARDEIDDARAEVLAEKAEPRA